jgi:hypothetical protein
MYVYRRRQAQTNNHVGDAHNIAGWHIPVSQINGITLSWQTDNMIEKAPNRSTLAMMLSLY